MITRCGLQNRRLVSAKAEQRTLLSPVGWQSRCEPHKLHGIELWRVSANDNCRDDVRRQPAKSQQGVDVGGGDSFSARDVVHAKLRVLNEPFLDVSAWKPPRADCDGGGRFSLACRRTAICTMAVGLYRFKDVG